jgi:hypothetical protein
LRESFPALKHLEQYLFYVLTKPVYNYIEQILGRRYDCRMYGAEAHEIMGLGVKLTYTVQWKWLCLHTAYRTAIT